MSRRASPATRNRDLDLDAAIRELDRIRAPLFREMKELLRNPDYHRGEPPHRCCTRERNQMRISPLEAEAIARALRTIPALRRKLPEILRRTRAEARRLDDSTRRQNFTCPLLEGTKCLVHSAAKPIGCAAWNPGMEFTAAGWRAFGRRDRLADRTHGPGWKLRVIPLWLARVLGAEDRRAPPARGED